MNGITNLIKKNSITILILSSFIIVTIYAITNIQKYDKVIKNEDGYNIHLMIKNDVLRYFSHGNEIKDDLKNGKDYFDTGRQNFTKYLYPRIVAAYYLAFDLNLFLDDDVEKNKVERLIAKGVHTKFLILQILLYYLSLIFLYKQIKHKFSNKILFFLLAFLCLEPTIVQYHGSFWSESIFFSLQILILALTLNDNNKPIKFFILGILLSLLALQRTNGFFYIIPIIIYFFAIYRFNFLKKIPYLIIGFLILLIFVSYHNYKKTGINFIIPTETKSVIHAYVLEEVLDEETLKKEKLKTLELAKSKNLDLNYEKLKNTDYSRYSFIFCESFKNKKENLEFLEMCKYLDKRSKKLVLSKPFETLEFFAKKSMSFVLLNPFHIYSDHKFLSGSLYYSSQDHKDLIKYRITYSLLIFLICLVGILRLVKLKNKNTLLLIILSSLYFFVILSWHGNNRYFTPVLIYMSFLFSFGIVQMLKIINSNIKIKILKYSIFFIFSLYIAETILTIKFQYYLNKNKIKLEKKIKENSNFDNRTIWQAYQDFKKKDPELFFYRSPVAFLNDKVDILPISGISKTKNFSYEQEHGLFPDYQTDRYGFRNLDSEWDKDLIEFFLIGDSYMMVGEYKSSIGENLRKISKNNNGILNLAQGGIGTLYQYAFIKEYLPRVNAKKVILFYFESNDLTNLFNELNNAKLVKYLQNENYSQNVYLKQKIIDKMYIEKFKNHNDNNLNIYSNNRTLVQFIEDQKKTNLIYFFKLYKIREFIFRNDKKLPIEEFKKIINLSKEFTKENGAEFYFVYVPEINRYIKGIPITYASEKYDDIIKIVKNLDIKYIDLHNELFLKAENPLIYFPLESFGHANKQAFQVIAKMIYEKFHNNEKDK